MYKKFLEGKILYFREVREEDVTNDYYNWLNDPEINQFLETRFIPRSKNNILEFVKKYDGNQNEILFAICDKTTEKHIGNIKLGPINWIHKKADISLIIGDKAFWGRGIATEAISLIVEFAFNTLNLNKLNAGCYENNAGSEKAFLKNGFTIEGKFIEEVFFKGEFINTIRLGLNKKTYSSIVLGKKK